MLLVIAVLLAVLVNACDEGSAAAKLSVVGDGCSTDDGAP
jgi:hypothetical protein